MLHRWTALTIWTVAGKRVDMTGQRGPAALVDNEVRRSRLTLTTRSPPLKLPSTLTHPLAAGTSMATAVAAGAAALVREYFTAGFYPTGTR